MSATTIRDFLVSLGYKVDKRSEQSFNDSLKQTAENAAKLGLAIEAAAAAVTGAVVKLAQGMEQSFYQSKRLGGSVKDINAVGYAISQVGGNADAAKQSMENIASFMRRLPGGKSYIQKLVGTGVDAGNVPAVMGALAKQFASMPYAQAKVRADFIGIDDDTLQAMIRDGGRYYDEYQKLAKKAGVDQQKYASDSHDLMVKVRSLGASFELLAMKITSALIDKAGPQIEKFKNWIDRNFDSITKTVTKAVDVITRLSDAIGTFVSRVIEWYDRLDPKSKELATTIAAVAGAVWLFNRAFGASPVGIILSLGTALVALYQDYQQWKETGDKGLVDWAKWEPTIKSVSDALATISRWFKTLSGDEEGGVGALQIAMVGFAAYMATTWAASLLSTFSRIGLGWKALAAYIAYDLTKTPEQRLEDASNRAGWVDQNVDNSTWGKMWGRASNAVRGWVGLEPKFNSDGSTKVAGETGYRGGLIRSESFQKKAPDIMKRLQDDLGLTEEQAAGIVGNFGHETGGFKNLQEINPLVPGSKGGWGWAQWTGPRRRSFEAWANERGLDPSSDEANYGFLLKELRTTHKYALDNLRKAGTSAEATEVFERDYEGAGIKNAQPPRLYRNRIESCSSGKSRWREKETRTVSK